MKRRISITLLFCLLITFLFIGCGESSGNNETDWRNEKIVDFVFDLADYSAEPVFYDDFNGTELDSTKWAKCPEWERQAHLANHGWWEDDCSWVENGNLVLEGKKDGDKLLSGAIRTKSKDFSRVFFEQAEGLFEFKFKAEYASGLWYAVWLMCPEEQDNIGNGATDGAEIDMIEILPNDNGRTYYQSAVHWDGYGAQHGSNHVAKNITKDFYDKWHVAQFIWHKHGYQLYIDGEKCYDMHGRDFGGTSKVPTYLKITSEFGRWGGPLDKDFESAKFYVDYIKVYERTSPYPYDVEEEPETPETDNEETEEAVNFDDIKVAPKTITLEKNPYVENETQVKIPTGFSSLKEGDTVLLKMKGTANPTVEKFDIQLVDTTVASENYYRVLSSDTYSADNVSDFDIETVFKVTKAPAGTDENNMMIVINGKTSDTTKILECTEFGVAIK